MYLKNLELSGFKSFGPRTSFQFSRGITAIVGPNGSGKSNVADALRWVLGEQSGRLLRTHRLQDVIFQGSASRPRASRAEATIVLDNSDIYFPFDSKEVSFGRRVRGVGESEYRVNDKRTRFREMQELLVKGNLGSNEYAIIGQGLVEGILSLRSEELRQLIEESAGIQRYRLRIGEARRRLAATHENIERLSLLRNEIAPRLGALEQQAKRVADHKRLTRQLSQILVVWYGHHWHGALERLAAAKAAHDQWEAGQVQARLALDDCETELTSLAQEFDQRLSMAGEATKEREGLAGRIRQLEHSISFSEKSCALLAERQRELEDSLAALNGEIRERTVVFQGADSSRLGLQDKLLGRKAVFNNKKAALADLESELSAMLGKADGAEQRAGNLRSAATALGYRMQWLERSQFDLGRELARMEDRRRSLISQLMEVARVTRMQRSQAAEIAVEIEEGSSRRQLFDTEIGSVRSRLSLLGEKQQARRGNLEVLKERLELFKEMRVQYRQQAAQPESSAIIEADGFVSTLSKVIQVPRGTETAIEAALADCVEGIIVEGKEEAVALAQIIAREGTRRSFVLPLDGLRTTPPLNIFKEKGVLGVAAQIVKCDNRFRPVVDALLGRTIVVENIQVAIRTLKRGMGTVVSLDGVVFHPLGSMSAGIPKLSEPNLLAHERDMTDIPEEMQRAQRSLDLTQREVDSLTGRLKDLEIGRVETSQEIESARRRRFTIQENLAGRMGRQVQFKGELRGLMVAVTQLREQKALFTRDAEQLGMERTSFLEEAKDAVEMAHYLRQGGALLAQRREVLVRETAEASSAVAKLSGELKTISEGQTTDIADLSRLKQDSATKSERLTDLIEERSVSSARIDREKKERDDLRQRHRTMSEVHGNEQAIIVQMEVRQRELRAELDMVRGKLDEGQRQLVASEGEIQRLQAELGSLRRRIEEDNLTIDDSGEVKALSELDQVEPSAIPPATEGMDEREQYIDHLPPISGGTSVDPDILGRRIEVLRKQIRKLGPVNPVAEKDYGDLKRRHDYLSVHAEDLNQSQRSLLSVIERLEEVMERDFHTTFAHVADKFDCYFQSFFGGGQAVLSLKENGVEIMARPPGKRTQGLTQLSGGEKALTALSLLFALLETSSSPFCILDEVDAMLDETNVGRFLSTLTRLSASIQFIVITHNRRTIEVADAIYGISMAQDGTSHILSMRIPNGAN